MAQLIPFNPSALANFQFSPVLDGTTYSARVAWNAYGLRYYLYVYSNSGALMLCVPLIASPDDYSINLAKGYFNTAVVYRASSGNIEVG